MIRVRCLGHISTSIGATEVSLDSEGLEAADLVDRVRSESQRPDPGFDRYNTLVLVGEGEAFVPAGVSRFIRGGESVVLIPVSHGG